MRTPYLSRPGNKLINSTVVLLPTWTHELGPRGFLTFQHFVSMPEIPRLDDERTHSQAITKFNRWFQRHTWNEGTIMNCGLRCTYRRASSSSRFNDATIISRPTPRLLSFALCVEWINSIYNTPDTGCLECYRPHASVNKTTQKIDRKHVHARNTDTMYIVKIVNKRPRKFTQRNTKCLY